MKLLRNYQRQYAPIHSEIDDNVEGYLQFVEESQRSNASSAPKLLHNK